MKKINLKTITIAMVIITLVAFGINGFGKTNTYKKYKLAGLAIVKGASYVKVTSDSVVYDLDGLFTTMYSFDYGIKQLSGK